MNAFSWYPCWFEQNPVVPISFARFPLTATQNRVSSTKRHTVSVPFGTSWELGAELPALSRAASRWKAALSRSSRIRRWAPLLRCTAWGAASGDTCSNRKETVENRIFPMSVAGDWIAYGVNAVNGIKQGLNTCSFGCLFGLIMASLRCSR